MRRHQNSCQRAKAGGVEMDAVDGEPGHVHGLHAALPWSPRLEYPELRRKVISLATAHRAITVLIEDAGPGMNLLQDLRAGMPEA